MNNSLSELEVDFIIEFSIKSNNSKSDQLIISTEYDKLLNLLQSQLDNVTVRRGNRNSDTLLIFVRASDSKVNEERMKESLSDYLHGVGNSNPRKVTGVISSAERLRLVYSLLTSMSIISPQFPHVISIFPLHNKQFNNRLLTLWSSSNHILGISKEELTDLKDHFGTSIALYFAFLQFYFSFLAFPTVFGLIFYLQGLKYNVYYSIGLLIWSIIFVESWRIKEKEWSVEWGTYGFKTVESIRTEFHSNKKQVDPVTNELIPSFPWYQTLLRQLSTIPIVLVFSAALAIMLCLVYIIETLVTEVYTGAGKRLLTLIPTILLSGLIPQFTKLWEVIARRLTLYENHKHNSSFSNSLTLKVFAFNFLLAYGALLLTSYVYIPFGEIVIPHILSLLSTHTETFKALESLPSGTFSINSSKLHTQYVAFSLTGQIIGAFTENVVPILLRVLNQEVSKVQDKRKASVVGLGGELEDEADEKLFLTRVRFEASLPVYNGFADYAEMALQFGYLVLFSAIWPLAPFFSLINNFFELRSDAFKLFSQSRRPIPTSRETSIGPWLEVLGFITWFGSVTNASLIYLYQPHYISSSSKNLLKSSLTNSTISLLSNSTSLTSPIALPDSCSTYTNLVLATLSPSKLDPNSYNNIKSTLFTALLVALASEHTYLVVREAVRYLLVRAIWINSKADVELRSRELKLKKVYLNEVNNKVDSEKSLVNEVKEINPELVKIKEVDDKAEGFWKRGDLGKIEINRRSKLD